MPSHPLSSYLSFSPLSPSWVSLTCSSVSCATRSSSSCWHVFSEPLSSSSNSPRLRVSWRVYMLLVALIWVLTFDIIWWTNCRRERVTNTWSHYQPTQLEIHACMPTASLMTIQNFVLHRIYAPETWWHVPLTSPSRWVSHRHRYSQRVLHTWTGAREAGLKTVKVEKKQRINCELTPNCNSKCIAQIS